MARRAYGSRRRSTSSRSGRGYRSTPSRRYASRASRAPARRGRATRDIRIVIEQPGASAIARPELIGKMPVVGLTSKRSRF